jgi:hypothetical protein
MWKWLWKCQVNWQYCWRAKCSKTRAGPHASLDFNIDIHLMWSNFWDSWSPETALGWRWWPCRCSLECVPGIWPEKGKKQEEGREQKCTEGEVELCSSSTPSCGFDLELWAVLRSCTFILPIWVAVGGRLSLEGGLQQSWLHGSSWWPRVLPTEGKSPVSWRGPRSILTTTPCWSFTSCCLLMEYALWLYCW